jgi:hypothetical protein
MSFIFLRCAALVGDEAGLETTEDDEGLNRGDNEKKQEHEEKEIVPCEGIAF